MSYRKKKSQSEDHGASGFRNSESIPSYYGSLSQSHELGETQGGRHAYDVTRFFPSICSILSPGRPIEPIQMFANHTDFFIFNQQEMLFSIFSEQIRFVAR